MTGDPFGHEPATPRGAVDRRLARVAASIAAYWAGGSGPSHSRIDGVMAVYETRPGSGAGNKQDKVLNSLLDLAAADLREFWSLAQDLVDLLDDDGLLTAEASAYDNWPKLTDRLRETLTQAGRGLGEDASIGLGTGAVAAVTAESVPACREQIERLRRAAAAGDGALVVGVAKELVESTVHVVLAERGVEVDRAWKAPKRAKEAELALGLHQEQHGGDDDASGHVRQILRSLHAIADEIVKLRNKRGTGHGGDQPSAALPARLTKFVSGAAIVYCEMLLDTLQDPDAPWHDRTDL